MPAVPRTIGESKFDRESLEFDEDADIGIPWLIFCFGSWLPEVSSYVLKITCIGWLRFRMSEARLSLQEFLMASTCISFSILETCSCFSFPLLCTEKSLGPA